MEDRIRAFVAIRLASEVDEAVARFQASLRTLGDDISWTKPASFHLTLRFLGNRVPPAEVEKMIDGLAPIAAATAPFMVQARGAGAFPSLKRPRVIWIGLTDGPLAEVAGKVEALSVKCGFEPQGRPFNPHLTIGRVRNPSRDARMHKLLDRMRERLELAADRDFGSSLIASMALYRSHLSPEGAKYEALATLPFEGI